MHRNGSGRAMGISKSKKKKGKDKAYALQDDSGSKTVAATFNPIKLGNMDGLLASLSDCVEDGYMSYIAQEPMNKKVPLHGTRT